MTTITITDQITSQTVTVTDWTDIPAALADWYDDAPDEITTAVEKLAQAVGAHQPTGEYESYLGVTVTQTS